MISDRRAASLAPGYVPVPYSEHGRIWSMAGRVQPCKLILRPYLKFLGRTPPPQFHPLPLILGEVLPVSILYLSYALKARVS